MAFGIDVKERAFALYCQGYSLDRISQSMGEEGTKVTRRTLINWEKQMGWKVRRRKVQEEARKRSDERHASDLAELSSQLAELQIDLFEELKEVRLKSKEGGINALRRLQEMRQRLLGDKRFEEQLDEIISAIFEILANDPKLGPVLQDRQHIIIEQLEKTLKEKYGIR